MTCENCPTETAEPRRFRTDDEGIITPTLCDECYEEFLRFAGIEETEAEPRTSEADLQIYLGH